MFAQILDDAREHKVRLPYKRIRNILKEKADCLDVVKVPSLVEYDCHEGNIFVKQRADGSGEYEIEGIIDFERAWWGDPLADFPAAFVFTDDIRKEEDFLETEKLSVPFWCMTAMTVAIDVYAKKKKTESNSIKMDSEKKKIFSEKKKLESSSSKSE